MAIKIGQLVLLNAKGFDFSRNYLCRVVQEFNGDREYLLRLICKKDLLGDKLVERDKKITLSYYDKTTSTFRCTDLYIEELKGERK